MKTFAFSTMPADLESSMQERNTPDETDVDPCNNWRERSNEYSYKN
jgi:hypothetical protein